MHAPGSQLNAAYDALLEALGKRRFEAAAEQFNRLSELDQQGAAAAPARCSEGRQH